MKHRTHTLGFEVSFASGTDDPTPLIPRFNCWRFIDEDKITMGPSWNIEIDWLVFGVKLSLNEFAWTGETPKTSRLEGIMQKPDNL